MQVGTFERSNGGDRGGAGMKRKSRFKAAGVWVVGYIDMYSDKLQR